MRLTSSSQADDKIIDSTLAMIIYTNALEQEAEEGTGYLDCFKGVDLRRTEIACVTWMCQQGCGAWVCFYISLRL